MAKIQINGKKVNLKNTISILEMVKKYKLTKKTVAIELNGKILPKAKYKQLLKDKDIVEIVHFIGGG